MLGDVVTSLLPSGRFALDSEPALHRDIILLGAGSGITPLFSILQQALHTEKAAHITLIYSNRDEKNAIFRERLLELQSRGSLSVLPSSSFTAIPPMLPAFTGV